MSMKIKIDLKQQKIFNSNMADNDKVEGELEDSLEQDSSAIPNSPTKSTASSDECVIPNSPTKSTDSSDECVKVTSDVDCAEELNSVSNGGDCMNGDSFSDSTAKGGVSQDNNNVDDADIASTGDEPFAMEVDCDDDEPATVDSCGADDDLTDEANCDSIKSSKNLLSDIESFLDCDVTSKDDVDIENNGAEDSSNKSEPSEQAVGSVSENTGEEKEGDDVQCSNDTSIKDDLSSEQKGESLDNEENMELGSEEKIMEVGYNKNEDDDDPFIPEIQCTVEMPEDDEEEENVGGGEGTEGTEGKGEGEGEITADAALDKGDTQNENLVAEEDLVTIKQEPVDDYATNQRMQSFAKEFLYSDTSSLGPPELESTGAEEGKKLSLKLFNKIVKAVSSADYSTLQDVYRLLYLRNPWDTKEVLAGRILDFAGFNFDENSEEFFNREMILRGMSQKTIETIANLLCLTKPISARSNRQKLALSTRIMKFLKTPEKLKRNRTASKQSKSRASPASSTPASPRVTDTPSSDSASSKSDKPTRSRKSIPLKLATKDGEKSVEKKAELVKSKSISVLKKNISLGNTKWASLALPEVKVELTKIKLSEIGKRLKIKVNAILPSSPGETSSDSNSKTSKGDETDEATETGKGEIKKLKEFPEVLSNIEGTPEMILSNIHYLLYLEDASNKDLKSNVMEFRGFPGEDGPSEISERKQFLEKFPENVIKDLANTFYLKTTKSKAENINLIINFLTAPSKRHMKETAEAPDKMCADQDTDLMDDYESDDSITCEVVHKKVDCIDLISSGDEDDEINYKKKYEKLLEKKTRVLPKP